MEWRDWAASAIRCRSPLMVISVSYFFGLVLLPIILVGGSATLCRWLARPNASTLVLATRFAYALVPLGFSMWLAHYCHHLLTSWSAIIPALQRFAGDLGWTILGQPAWALACCRPVLNWLPQMEILSLDVGLLFSLYSGYRIALTQSQRTSQALKIFAPWAVLIGPLVRGRSLDCAPTHADAWNPITGRLRMRSLMGIAIFGWLFLGTGCGPARADGGTLRLTGKKGRFQISVFTAPTPFRAGPVDISVLLQDASSGDLVTQGRVIVRMSKAGRPALEYPATFEAATNKLFRAAQFELPDRGHWEIQVEVESAQGTGVDRRRTGSSRGPTTLARIVAMDLLARAGDCSLQYSSSIEPRRTIRFILPAVKTDTLSKSASMRKRHACMMERQIDASIKSISGLLQQVFAERARPNDGLCSFADRSPRSTRSTGRAERGGAGPFGKPS